MRQPELKIKRARGFLLILAILVLVVIAVAIAALGNMTSADIRSSSGHAQSEQAYFAAASGIEYAAHQFKTGAGTNNAACTAITNATPVAVGSASFTLTGTYLNPANTSISIVGGITATDTVIPTPANGTLNFASHGRILIDGEQIVYRGKTSASFTGVRRGFAGTTPTTHANAAAISQNQCLVRATGTSGSAVRAIESAIQTGPWTDFMPSTGSVAVPTGAVGPISTFNSTLPAGTNLVIAIVSLRNTNAVRNIGVGGLRLVRANGAGAGTLSSNLYQIDVGGAGFPSTAAKFDQKTYFFVYADAPAPANAVYRIDGQASAAINAEVKMLVISNPPTSAPFATGTVTCPPNPCIGTIAVNILSNTLASWPPGDNLVVAAVQWDNTAGQTNFDIGKLELRNSAGAMDSNTFAIGIAATANVNANGSMLLVARDVNASANPTYTVRGATLNNNRVQARADMIVIQGMGAAAPSVLSSGIALTSGLAVSLGSLATALPNLTAGAANLVIAATHYRVTSNTLGDYPITAGGEDLMFSGGVKGSNAFAMNLCRTSIDECNDFPTGQLWEQTAGGANPIYDLQTTAGTINMSGRARMLAIQAVPVADRVEIIP